MDTNMGSVDMRRMDYLQLITQETRANILRVIRGHPQKLPSMVELDLLLEEHKSTLYEHLSQLIDKGIIVRYMASTEQEDKSPYVFYGLTPLGYDLVESTTVFESAEEIREEYQNRAAGCEISAYERLPRPQEAVDTVREQTEDIESNQ